MKRVGHWATTEAVTIGKDLSGSHAIVTGANTGIGFETARVHFKVEPRPLRQGVTGRRTSASVPRPSLASTIRPPCASTMARAT